MNFFKKMALIARGLVSVICGWVIYSITQKTPSKSHRDLIHLFCLSGGACNDVFAWLISKTSRSLFLPDGNGVLGNLDDSDVSEIVSQLEEKGYAVFESVLDVDSLSNLMQFALTTPATVRRMDDQMEGETQNAVLYNPKEPRAVTYDFKTSDILKSAEVQKLLADKSIIQIAAKYLQCVPLADVTAMWWTTNFKAAADGAAAQLYHFDMDRIKWLKVFVYVTDVGVKDGPHSFIEGSHRTGGIPSHMLQKGYTRLTDSEVRSYYSSEREKRFAAPRGTIIIEDTRGLHKGNPVELDGKPRLILQFQFSNSLFGANYAKHTFGNTICPSLRRLISLEKKIYANYL